LAIPTIANDAACHYPIFKNHNPQVSMLKNIGIWTGFDSAEVRKKTWGTIADPGA
jgi:hypothetical protein